MKINVFAGARRFSGAAAIVWAIGWICAIVLNLFKSGSIHATMAGVGMLVVGLLGGFLSVTLIGWIVRGFMGIPMGKDSREEGSVG